MRRERREGFGEGVSEVMNEGDVGYHEYMG